MQASSNTLMSVRARFLTIEMSDRVCQSALDASMIERNEEPARPAFDFPQSALQIGEIGGGGHELFVGIPRRPPASQRFHQPAAQ